MLLPLVLDLRQARGEAGRMLTPERRLVNPLSKLFRTW
jgi:hypothetical protein